MKSPCSGLYLEPCREAVLLGSGPVLLGLGAEEKGAVFMWETQTWTLEESLGEDLGSCGGFRLESRR